MLKLLNYFTQDTWVLPSFLYLYPQIAEKMIQYRLDRLPAAVENAASYGKKGGSLILSSISHFLYFCYCFHQLSPFFSNSSILLRKKKKKKNEKNVTAKFPWESASTGVECIPNPTRNIEGKYEIHVGADISMAIQLYYNSCQNKTWLNLSWPLVRDVARFFTSRVFLNNISQVYLI